MHACIACTSLASSQSYFNEKIYKKYKNTRTTEWSVGNTWVSKVETFDCTRGRCTPSHVRTNERAMVHARAECLPLIAMLDYIYLLFLEYVRGTYVVRNRSTILYVDLVNVLHHNLTPKVQQLHSKYHDGTSAIHSLWNVRTYERTYTVLEYSRNKNYVCPKSKSNTFIIHSSAHAWQTVKLNKKRVFVCASARRPRRNERVVRWRCPRPRSGQRTGMKAPILLDRTRGL